MFHHICYSLCILLWYADVDASQYGHLFNIADQFHLVPKRSTTTPPTKYTWISMITSSTVDIIGARVLAQSLQRHETQYDMTLLVTPDVMTATSNIHNKNIPIDITDHDIPNYDNQENKQETDIQNNKNVPNDHDEKNNNNQDAKPDELDISNLNANSISSTNTISVVSMLRDFGWKIIEINSEYYKSLEAMYGDSLHGQIMRYELSKAMIFNLTNFESIGYLSSQTMVTSNIDYLFQCGTEAFCGASFNHKENIFDENIFLIKPDSGMYNDIVRFIISEGSQIAAIDAKNARKAKMENEEQNQAEKQTQKQQEQEKDKSKNKDKDKEMHTPHSYISEYFHYYCVGSGYPVNKHLGHSSALTYKAPQFKFDCGDKTAGCVGYVFLFYFILF